MTTAKDANLREAEPLKNAQRGPTCLAGGIGSIKQIG
jgi:hypothetical protein